MKCDPVEVEEREGTGECKLMLANVNRVKEVHPVAKDSGVNHGPEASYETR
jgi:hypothetical protein